MSDVYRCPTCNVPQWSDEHLYPDLDAGIRYAVRALREAGVETVESCEGGLGHPENPGGEHAYPSPTVHFVGDEGAGWRALSVLISLGIPVEDLRRTWSMVRGVPTGPCWEVTFARRLNDEESQREASGGHNAGGAQC